VTPADRWVEAWFRAWRDHDPEALASVYTPGPVQRSEPFRERIEPRAYAASAFADEDSVEVWFAEPHHQSELAAACEWWAVSRDRGGATTTLGGVSLIRIDENGRVSDQRDYWSSRDGAHHPPDDWGPVAYHA
jgi:hypothetical protein